MMYRAYNRHPYAALAVLDFIESSLRRQKLAKALGFALYDEKIGIDLRYEAIKQNVDDTLRAIGGISVVIEMEGGAMFARLHRWVGQDERFPPDQQVWVGELGRPGVSFGLTAASLQTDLEQECSLLALETTAEVNKTALQGFYI